MSSNWSITKLLACTPIIYQTWQLHNWHLYTETNEFLELRNWKVLKGGFMKHGVSVGFTHDKIPDLWHEEVVELEGILTLLRVRTGLTEIFIKNEEGSGDDVGVPGLVYETASLVNRITRSMLRLRLAGDGRKRRRWGWGCSFFYFFFISILFLFVIGTYVFGTLIVTGYK